MNAKPEIGKWYQMRGGEQFEVVAIDDEDATIEVQYFDGTVEELERSDWASQYANGGLEEVDAQEDGKGSADFDGDEAFANNNRYEGSQMSDGLDGLDLFETPDSLQ
jgi:hypothetical protein